MSCDVAAARRKLRHAEILRDYLIGLPKEIALAMRRARHADYTPVLEALFSASFGAVRACFFILHRTGGPDFKSIEGNWRNCVLDQEQRHNGMRCWQFATMTYMSSNAGCYRGNNDESGSGRELLVQPL